MSTDALEVDDEIRAALADSVRDLMSRRGDTSAIRAAFAAPGRIDRPLWNSLCGDIGFAALPIAEKFGGAGASIVESGIVLEEIGAALVSVPALSTAIAAAAVQLTGDVDAAQRLLPDLASGTRLATVCWAGEPGWSAPGVTAEAGLLSGTAHYVLDGEVADVLMVIADSDGHVTVHEVASESPGVGVHAQPSMDPTRPLSTVTFDDVLSTPIPTQDDFLNRLRVAAWALLAAEQVGTAQASLDRTVEYAGARSQFGRTIGSFQALKHRMADMYALVETSRSMARAALAAVHRDDPDAAEQAAAAHVYCSEAATTVAGEAIQIHGGIGITWEHDIQLYFKRAHGSAQLFGQPHELVADLAAGL